MKASPATTAIPATGNRQLIHLALGIRARWIWQRADVPGSNRAAWAELLTRSLITTWRMSPPGLRAAAFYGRFGIGYRDGSAEVYACLRNRTARAGGVGFVGFLVLPPAISAESGHRSWRIRWNAALPSDTNF